MRDTKKLVLTAVLAALGAVLMILEIPYFIIPFLKIELSDVVVLLVYTIGGFVPALIVGMLKAFVNFLVFGPVGQFGIGQITAVLASLSFILGFEMFKRVVKNKYLVLVGMVLSFTLIMTAMNYLFITPIWFGKLTFLDVQEWVNLSSFGLKGNFNYLMTIIYIYVPFNLIKGTIIATVFQLTRKSLSKFIDRISK